MSKLQYPVLGGFILSCCASPALGQQKEVSFVAVETAPVIDGVLDDDAWKSATVIIDFHQVEPIEGAMPSEDTTVYLAHDKDMVYVGARLFDSEPTRIIAREMQRDGINTFFDDVFMIAFDTFLDRRNGYLFAVNPLGTKVDQRVENNSSYRGEWDGIWHAKAKIDAEGWVVEMAVPFKTVSFDPTNDSWGLNIERRIRRRNEKVRWANASQNNQMYNVAGFGEIDRLDSPDQGLGLDVRYVIDGINDRQNYGAIEQSDIEPNIEVVYKFTPSLIGSLVVNPQFSDVRVDNVISNLTRFSQFFVEQRDFFVRDADIFQFADFQRSADGSIVNGMPFHSRRIGLVGDRANPDIVDMDVGAKLSGRVGHFTVGMLIASMGKTATVDEQNLSVVRATMDVLSESRMGLILTHGDPAGEVQNTAAGVDFRYRNSSMFDDQTLIVDAHLLKSSSSGLDGDDMAVGLGVEFPNDIVNFNARIAEIQENYSPALGFANRTGIRTLDGRFRYRTRPGSQSYLRTIDNGINWRITTDTNTEIQSSRFGIDLIGGQNNAGDSFSIEHALVRENLDAPFTLREGIVIPVDDYHWHRTGISLQSANSREVSIGLSGSWGGFYGGEQSNITGRFTWRPNSHILASYEHQRINTSLPQGDLEINIDRIRFDISFTNNLFWTNYFQREDESDLISLQTQLRWIRTPGSELIISVNHNWRRGIDSDTGLQTNGYENVATFSAIQFFLTQRF